VPSKIPRLALVIGAEHYHPDRGVDPVPNALNDARRMRDVLQQSGFSFVRLLPDPDSAAEIQDYVKELQVKSGPDDDPAVLVFFFAGHGFQNGENNYIVPTGARSDYPLEDSLPVSNIVQALATHKHGIAVLFFDSCRTGVSETDSSVPGTTNKPVGFSAMREISGVDMGLATEFGKTAKSKVLDADVDSPYTTALAKYISHPSMSLANVFDWVEQDVISLTNTQKPVEVKGAFDTGFFFVPQQAELDAERQMWQIVIQNGQPDCVNRFVYSHPGGDYLRSGLAWLADPSHPEPKGGTKCPLP
jgi:hypothetical protein